MHDYAASDGTGFNSTLSIFNLSKGSGFEQLWQIMDTVG